MSIDKKNISLYVKMLALYFACLPLGAMNIGAFGSALKIVALLPTLAFFFTYGLGISITKPVTYQIGIAILAFISYVWSPFTLQWWATASGQILFVILLLPTVRIYLTPEEDHYLKKSLVLASRLTLILAFLFSSYNQDGRLWLNGVISEDPNYLCTYFLFGVAFALDRIMSNTKVITRLLAGVELLLYLYIEFAAGSRSGMLATLVVCIFYFLFNQRSDRKNFGKKILIVILLLVAVVVAFQYLPDYITDRFFYSSIKESGGSGRFEIWGEVADVFFHSNPFYGILGWGAGAAAYAISTLGYWYQVPHNAFLHFLLEEGLVGLIFYCSIIVFTLKKAVRKRNFFEISIMLGMIVFSFSASVIAFKPYWNIIMLCLFDICGQNEYENDTGSYQ